MDPKKATEEKEKGVSKPYVDTKKLEQSKKLKEKSTLPGSVVNKDCKSKTDQ